VSAAIFIAFGAVLGSAGAHAAVAVVFVVAVVLALGARPVTLWGQLAKWIILVCCIGVAVADVIYQFGSPLAGSLYWSIVRMAAVALLPAAAVLLAVAWRKKENQATIGISLIVAVAAGLCLLFVS
jgi:hypothetical protein